jgi:AcrR family transcriptional regulator
MKNRAAVSGEGGTWQRRKDARPGEILAAARALLEAEGTLDLPVARIAAAAGVSEATVYKYFSGKQGLIDRVLLEWAMPLIDTLTTELPRLPDLRAQLAAVARNYLRSMGETPRLHQLFYQELRWTNYRGSPLHQLNQRLSTMLGDCLQAAVDRGELCADLDLTMVRDMLFGGLEHIAMRTSLIGRPLAVNEEAARYVSMMMTGLAPRPALAELNAVVARLGALVEGNG